MSASLRPDPSALRASAFDALPMTSAVLDRSGHIVLINAADTSLARAGIRPRASIGEPYHDICVRLLADPAELLHELDAVLAGRRRVFEGEFRSREDHGRRWFHVTIGRVDRPDSPGPWSSTTTSPSAVGRRNGRGIAPCTIR